MQHTRFAEPQLGDSRDGKLPRAVRGHADFRVFFENEDIAAELGHGLRQG